jgi:two-component system chemotaxis response regulator CheB
MRPSADVLFRSAVKIYGEKTVGLIMTGMGEDGADGIEDIRKAGGHTLAQDRATSVVFGMPKAAIDRRAVHKVLPLSEIGPYLNSLELGPGRLS